MTDSFYVYMYRNPLKGGEAFYIGKGFKERMYDHVKPHTLATDRNLHKVRTINLISKSGIPPIIDIVGENLSEEHALSLEIETIAKYGRADLGDGPLTNLTNGGEGLVGLVRNLAGENNPNYGKRGENSVWWGRSHTEETKEKIRLSQVGKTLTPEHIAAMRKPRSAVGRAALSAARKASHYRPSEETKRIISEALKGRPSPRKGVTASAEARAKQSAATKGRPKRKAPCTHCGLLFAANILSRFHNDNCKVKP